MASKDHITIRFYKFRQSMELKNPNKEQLNYLTSCVGVCHRKKVTKFGQSVYHRHTIRGWEAYNKIYGNVKPRNLEKKKLGNPISPLPTIPLMDSDGNVQHKLELILETRMTKVANHASNEVLIKWVGALIEDSS